ncbi:putative glycoside hydrolase [Streptomyces sp. HNM0574]|uniref:putative glycoside hydrolase n=1 Tax=Streptomyces sp. HNM0574 TaxID=2714954 RepID=UPI00146B6C1C|nr:putative glycoside hydrolase [Streptomyces sp. HNM0574]NLU68771.1 putative glycoside hydrolase [Streptomyces sp. HNM0574]
MRLADWKTWLLSLSPRRSGSSPSTRFPRRRAATLVCGVLALVLVAGSVVLARALHRPELRLEGLPSDGKVNAAHAKSLREEGLSVSSDGGAEPGGTRATLDGRPLRAHADGRALSVRLGALREGKHQLRVAQPGSALAGAAETVRTLTVDTTAPRIEVAGTEADSLKGPVTVEGKAPGAQRVEVQGRKARLQRDGSFAARLPRPPARTTVTATDAAGNTAREDSLVTVRRPQLKAVHVSSQGWASDNLREPVMKLLKEKKINAVQLDIKDELGEIGYDSEVPLAKRIGAAKGYYDVKKAVEEIHAAGGAVVGRIVAFRDPVLASASWKSGHRDRVVQKPGGGPYDGGSYGELSFTNFANEEVRQYHVDLAEEAAKLGFDDILYDYIRRPDGRMSGMRVPGLGDTTPEQSIADVVAKTRTVAREHGAFLGVSVFGIAVTRPEEIAQDIGKLAQQCDYIAPMIYPSHWAAGEYGVSEPDAHPYEITKKSLADFKKKTRHTNAEIVPWIQDFSMGSTYGDAEVRAQIDAARADGIDGFLLWNPGVRYHGGALD